jgi:N-acetylglucosaminyldiphosphoundecaprenol N-acetyl-beta-D-mannosaminyltransferase
LKPPRSPSPASSPDPGRPVARSRRASFGPPGLESRLLIGMRVDATGYPDATDRILAWARAGEARSVGVATVNNVMESHDDSDFREVMNGCDLVTPDGMPLVWGLKLLGVRNASRVYGPSLTPRLLARAAQEGVPVAFYGGAPEVIDELAAVAVRRWPELRIAYRLSPPFRELSPEEDDSIVEDIRSSGARIVFVGLGCPKQERWMAEHRDRLGIVLVGIGAAFDFLAGTKRQAPAFVQRVGLEWVFRLATEPRRLWRRYLRHNPRFVAYFGAQVLRTRLGRGAERDDTQGNRRRRA